MVITKQLRFDSNTKQIDKTTKARHLSACTSSVPSKTLVEGFYGAVTTNYHGHELTFL